MKRLLWVGDAGCSSGFGRATHHIAKELVEDFEVMAIGVNYTGEPHDEPYHIWPAYIGGDPLGIARFRKLLPRLHPDVVVFQTNPWHVPYFMGVINDLNKEKKLEGRPTLVGIIAVEGKNCKGVDLNSLDRAIFWTEFGLREARGCAIPSGVVGLGVDLEQYKPGDKFAARQALGLPAECMDAFIVTNVNRNQHRKRLDLSIQYFAEWYHKAGRPNAYLYMHCLPGSTTQLNLEYIADYYGIAHRLIVPEFTDFFSGVIDKWVVTTYQAGDLGINSGLGEGWGLTVMEGMACGIPQIAVDHAAVPEWAGDAVRLIKPSSVGVMPDVFTMIGAVPDKDDFVGAIDDFYRYPLYHENMRLRGLECVANPKFRWENIGKRFALEIKEGLCSSAYSA